MRPRLRAAGILAVLGAGTLLLSAAVPPNAPALFNEPAGFDPANPNAQPVIQTSAEPPPGAVTPKTAVQELRAMGALHLDPSGTVRSITAPPGKSLGANGAEFVKRYAGAFGLTKSHSLVQSSSVGVPGGDQVVRYQQTAGGLPILGGEVVITTGKNGVVQSAITDTTPLAPFAPAKLDPAAARGKGLAAAAQKYSLDAAALGSQTGLWLYDATKNGAPGAPQLRPTYWVKIADQEHEVASVLVDGIDGSIKLIASEHRSGEQRSVCDLGNTRVNLNSRLQYVCNRHSALGQQGSSRHEGGGSSSNADVNDAYNRLGAAYDYFKNTFGRDSYDGRGEEVRATVRACDTASSCPFENAFWEGYQFVFGQGWATDDVAAHEYTHAVTEHASSLYYWHESGAINEALSDIFGEFIDLATPGDSTDDTDKRWLVGENLPAGPYHPTGGAIRNMANPRAMGDPSQVRGENWDHDHDLSDNGGVHTNSGPANLAAKLIYDGGVANGIGSPLPGLGPVKAAHLWYRVMHLLPSGANYAQLGNVISSSCRQLIGHWGFTIADCQQTVDPAMTAIGSGNSYRTPLPYPELCQSLQPPTALFSDDMEHGTTKWTFSNNHYWQMIPTPAIPYSYAKSGKGSINGWNNRGGAGNGTYIETTQPIVLPAGSSPKLHFAHSLTEIDFTRYTGDPVILAQINDGTGWQPLPINSTPPGAIFSQTIGYERHILNLTSYAGRSVKLRFQLQTATSKFIDWYLDDVWVYTCGNTTGPAQDHYGFQTPGGLSVNWMPPTWVAQTPPPSVNQPFHWELSYSPAIPGAPTTVNHVDGWNSLLLAQADPSTTYKVTIAARTEDGQLGQPVVITVTPHSPVVCPYSGVSSVTMPFPGRRQPPGAPIGQCFRTPIPRR